jgi:hypothetical protein
MENEGPMTFGEKAVGLTFNPSGDPTVEAIKRKCADLIDDLDSLRNHADTKPEIKRMLSIAVTELQTAQMWAVKAATWRY